MMSSSPLDLISGLVFPSRRCCNIAAFHIGRCGSRVLGDLLKQHSNVVWDGELFSPARLEGIAARWPLLTRDRWTILRLRMAMAGKRCFGFETQPTQVDPMHITLPDYVERLEQMRFSHFVVLERKNSLHRIISILRGHHTSQWHLKTNEERSKTQFKLDVENLSLNWGTDTEQKSLIDHLEHSEQIVNELKQVLSSRNHLFLSYEDDIKPQPERAYRRLCEFTGLDVEPVTVRLKKTNPDSLANILTNFSEVEETLRGTAYEWMLQS